MDTLLAKLRALFRRKNLEAEMAEEMRQHLERRTQEKIAEGMTPNDARYAAQREFGGTTQVQELCRDEQRFVWLEQVLQDGRFAARGLRKNPGFTVVAVLTLALGIGVNTSMFTALQSILMRELPFPDPDRIVEVFRTSPHSQRGPHSPANFLDQQAQNTVFEFMAATHSKPLSLSESGQPAERVRGMQVSANFFPLLGVQPALGRVFTAEEDQAGRHHVAILDERFWQQRFAGDPNILGRTLRLDGENVTVIGVMPASFRDQRLLGATQVWRPIAFTDAQRRNRGGNYLDVYARLRPGVSVTQAQAAMDAFRARQAREQGDSSSAIGLRVVRLADAMDPRGRLALWLTMGLAGFVLLIACANLANLQFARTARRTHELAIRGALGASRGRLLRQLLTESLLIALLGGTLGVVLGYWGNALLSRQIMSAGGAELTLNLRVLGFALGASTLSGFAFGLVPAWLASRDSTHDAMKPGARGSVGDRARNRLQHALIVLEVALALVLLAGAGLMVRGLQRFALESPGWKIDGLTVGYLTLPDARYARPETQRDFAERLHARLAALPGVERAALAWSLPIREFNVATNLTIPGRDAPPGREPTRFLNAVTPGYFATLNMRIIAGRDFTAADTADRAPVVIINEAIARAFWPRESPLGRRIGNEEIIGVVSDVRFATDPGEPGTSYQTYRPFAQEPRGFMCLAIQGNVAIETLRRVVTELDADLPLNDPGLARAAVDRTLANFNVVAGILSSFGALGLLLASLGIYGVIASFVVQRTNEIGVRIALGATGRDVLWLVIGRGLRLTLLGSAIGVLGAIATARVLRSLAPALAADDPIAIGVVATLLVAVALFACWLPARRAVRLDPTAALRSE